MLTAAQAAARLQLHERTVRRMCQRGDLAGVLVAGRWRLPEETLPGVAPARPAPPVRVRLGRPGRFAQVAREVTGAMTPTEQA